MLAALAQTAMVGLALTLSTTAGGTLQVSSTDVAAIAGLTAASALWAAIGVGVGALVRHQVAAIAGVIVWVLVVENLGASLMGDIGRYLPGQAAHGLAQLSDLLAVPLAAAVLTAYTAVAVIAAGIATARRDF